VLKKTLNATKPLIDQARMSLMDDSKFKHPRAAMFLLLTLLLATAAGQCEIIMRRSGWERENG
jgi:hypothetical protein